MKVTLFGRASALAVALAVSGFAGTSYAQNTKAAAEPQDSAGDVGTLVVTGSFLKGKEETALPVDVVGTEELSQRGAPTMVQFIKTIPSSGAVLGENNRFGGGNGVSTVNLRSLGSSRTLVLFNGQRIAGTIRSGNGVDLNTLPNNAIARVDVLKDGAAATYGSDAIGGVVNFVSRTNLEGFELTGQYQAIRGSDGDYNAGLAWGHVMDRGNVLFTANYRARSTLPVEKRDWALRTGVAGYLQNPQGGWAATGNPGVYSVPNSANPADLATNSTAQSSLTDIGCLANGGAPFTANQLTYNPTACQFQYTTFDNLVEDEKNLQLYGELNVDLTDRVRFHSGVMYAFNNTPHQSWAVTGPNQWPTPISSGGVSPVPSAAANVEQSRFYIPANNPGLQALISQVNSASCTSGALPYGTNAANCATTLTTMKGLLTNAGLYGVSPTQANWRPIGFGGDPSSSDGTAHYSYKTTSFRIDGGFKGDFENGIGWQTSALYQNVKYNATLTDISVNRLQLALAGYGSRAGDSNQCDPSEQLVLANAGNAAAGCYFFNPFTNAFSTSMSGAAANPFYIDANSPTANSIVGFNTAATNRAAVVKWMESDQPSHNTTELFVVDGVLNGELPWFKLWSEDKISWALGAQYRYDRIVDAPEQVYDANATPCVDSAPFGDNIPSCAAPNGPFLFNANRRPYDVNRKIASGFTEVRFPVTDKWEITAAGRYENYQGIGSTTNPKVSTRWQALDWLAFRGSVGSTYRAPNPTSVTNTFNRGLTNASGTWRASDTYGNPNLKPETADTLSVGALFDYKAINMSFDYWSFDFKDQLTTESTTDLINLMFPSGAPNRCADAALLARFEFFGSCALANVKSYKVYNINGGKVKTSGVDFQFNLDGGKWWETDVKFGIDGSYLLQYDESPYTFLGTTYQSSAVPVVHRVGTYRSSAFAGYNRVRANGFINLQRGIHNLRWQMRFISSSRQVDGQAAAILFQAPNLIPSYIQHDLTYRVDLPKWGRGTQLTLGVQNVFDKDPPFAFNTQYNYDPGSGNPLGRVYTVSVKKNF